MNCCWAFKTDVCYSIQMLQNACRSEATRPRNWKKLKIFGLARLSSPSLPPTRSTNSLPKARLLAPQLGHVNSHEHSYGHGAGNGHHHIPPVPGKGRGRRGTWGRGVDRHRWGFSHMGLLRWSEKNQVFIYFINWRQREKHVNMYYLLMI